MLPPLNATPSKGKVQNSPTYNKLLESIDNIKSNSPSKEIIFRAEKLKKLLFLENKSRDELNKTEDSFMRRASGLKNKLNENAYIV